MNIIAVDDERIALQNLVEAIGAAAPDAAIYEFRNADEALRFAAEHPCDIAFLDIEMRGISGIELAKRLKGFNTQINIVFVTGCSQYTGDALHLRASGYVMKPATKESVLEELENLRHPVKRQTGKCVWVQTFGNFEVFVDDQALHFKYSRSKELLAYLIDRRGALCTNGELECVLWEDESGNAKKAAYLRKLRSDLIHTLDDAECEDVLVVQPGKLGVVPEKIECDYFDWNDGKAYALNAYHGEYMSQFSWAEMTHSAIEASLRRE